MEPSLEPNALDAFQFNQEIQQVLTPPQENASSFTALLELPWSQAIQLLHHSPESNDSTAPAPPHSTNHTVTVDAHHTPYHFPGGANLTVPSNRALVQRPARFSVFADSINNATTNKYNHKNNNYSPETTESMPSNSIGNIWKVKDEPAESDSNIPDSSPPAENKRSVKRKGCEKKVKVATKKSKSGANESSEDAKKLPYVHLRARRGQATDSHSLTRRPRCETINARMKLLQELVPGCDEVAGTALVLDEIINHVQLLQRQVEFLSIRLAAVSPIIDSLAAQGWRLLSVFFLVMEAISVVLDVYGKSKKNFLLAAFVLSAFGFIITIYAFIRKRSTAAYVLKPVSELAWVEVAFSVPN